MKKIIISLIVAIFVLNAVSCRDNKVFASINEGKEEIEMLQFEKTDELVLNDLLCDGAVFQRDKPVTITGLGASGAELSIQLYKGDKLVEKKNGKIPEDGSFSVDLSARPASFDKYTLKVTSGEYEKVVNDILFGDIYLAGGQSNMEFKLGNMYNSIEYTAAHANSNIRVFQTVNLIYGDASHDHPYEPQFSLGFGKWVTCDISGALTVSAIGFVFAAELTAKLAAVNKEVPIGIIDISVGGTTAETWIGREYVDENLLPLLKAEGRYPEKDRWNKAGPLNFTQLAAGYNTKFSAVRSAKISGVIWYQGESNIDDHTFAMFEAVNDKLIEQYSDVFGFERGTLPFGACMCATYDYYKNDQERLPKLWDAQAQMLRSKNGKVSLVTTYDLPSDYVEHPAHPIHKREIGVRLADSMFECVYNGGRYSAPILTGCEKRGSSVVLTIDGLDIRMADGDESGFYALDTKGTLVPISRDAITISGNTAVIELGDVQAVKLKFNYNQTAKNGCICDSKGQHMVPFEVTF